MIFTERWRLVGPRLAALGLLCVGAGCGGAPAPTYPVEGTVRLDGAPLRHGVVLFEAISATGSNGAYTARGRIGPEGRYSLSTFAPGDGAVAGRHRVVVAQEPPASDPYEPGSEPPVAAIPAEYTSPRTSPLEVEVGVEPNTIDIDLRTH